MHILKVVARRRLACTLLLVSAMGVAGCAFTEPYAGFDATVPNEGEVPADATVDVYDKSVTERDLEVATAMGVPGETYEAMRGGAWASDNDRRMVRYAEIAIDHITERYAVEAEPVGVIQERWPSLGNATIHMRITSGDKSGEEIELHIEAEGYPHVDSDNMGALMERDSFTSDVESVAADTLAGILPEGTYAVMSRMPDAQTSPGEKPSGWMRAYVLESALGDGMDEAQVMSTLVDGLGQLEYSLDIRVLVLANDPEDGKVTPEYGQEQLAENMRAGDVKAIVSDETEHVG